MKIVHLILGKARLDRANGVNRVAHNLATKQAELGHEVEIWGITSNPNQFLAKRPYKLKLFQTNRNRFRVAKGIKSEISWLSRAAAMVHIHGCFIPEFSAVAKQLRKQGIPYVYSPHGGFSPGAIDRGGWKKRFYFQQFEKPLVLGAHALHFLGPIQFHAFDRWLPGAQKVIIPNGQNFEELSWIPWPQDIHSERPIFSFCGRLSMEHKGLDLLLKGFARYCLEGGRGALWLIGDGEDRKPLTRLAKKLKVRERVTFHGSVFGEEKLNLLYHSDWFIHPSRYEGMPCSVLEAAGLGKPSIISEYTNLGSVIQKRDAGIVLPQLDVIELTNSFNKAERLYLAKEHHLMGIHAKQMVQEDFTWESIAQRFVHLYQNDPSASPKMLHAPTPPEVNKQPASDQSSTSKPKIAS
ncbi:MAG: glycosyltransferase [Bacteroidota bacterium]